MLNFPLVQLLAATAIAAVIGMGGFLISSNPTSEADVRIEPTHGLVKIGDTFAIHVIVTARTPVNVFRGVLRFDANALEVASIDYNTSIANLWAEEPWYSNGDGTISFTGGTAQSGGFLGEGSLITITFNTKSIGETSIGIDEMRIMKYDGLGTEITVEKPIDTIFAVEENALKEQTILNTAIPGPVVTIVNKEENTDLNHDGKQTIADVSIFMTDYIKQNLRSDFNQDGKVNLKDLSILTG